MSRFDPVPPVPVAIGPCLCPGTPHDGGDVVYLAPVLSAAGGMAAQGAIADAASDGVLLQELLWRIYRDHGIVDWNLVDEEGDPVPLTPENKTQALPYGKGGEAVANKADELYNEDVLRPFLARLTALQKLAAEEKRRQRAARSKAGSTTPTPKATSATPTSIGTRRKRSSTGGSAKVPPAA